ncbi:hypothetical protein TNIN_245261 [Trichonephila inaurata madagascariensis]|uniref:Uncharacterized protein n=1 Tax=Trichonephila inaurata madagascariensis TaxID=2747483 RepID=A0A8X6WTE2_9ARAC|nr:hypothetical protein TNIN_245261 [Trichonephila inaurata madagascariensis]
MKCGTRTAVPSISYPVIVLQGLTLCVFSFWWYISITARGHSFWVILVCEQAVNKPAILKMFTLSAFYLCIRCRLWLSAFITLVEKAAVYVLERKRKSIIVNASVENQEK